MPDRIHDGWAGRLIGGIEGLPHEFTFLKNGACTDDDNDFEWTHLWFMDKEDVIKLPCELTQKSRD
ncbi:MAG: hypothetical protein HY298_18115 [Verrucomicrobia bacterium]|nr:hypothetical protein [Verrucomicrobiota bacterium]